MESFDMVVIGGGTGGLVTASGSAQLGAKVALIERDKLGGECLWTGCVPSKTLIESAKTKHRIDQSRTHGFEMGEVRVDFARVMEHVWETIMAIQPHDDPKRFRDMGVDVIEGTARFTGPDRLEVNGRTLVSRRFCIATGGDVMVPPIEGIDTVPYLTHENFFDIRKRPEHLIVIGAGPIGCELGQSMRRLGSRVTLIETLDCILHNDDHELACLLHSYLEAEGISVKVSARATKVHEQNGKISLYCQQGEKSFEVEGDVLLMATGKRPRTAGLGLETAGVELNKGGIRVDATMRTTNPRIYACGDVAGPYLFTHMAEYQAGLIISNALIPILNRKADLNVVPWVTFTDPELAHIGLSEEPARKQYGVDGIRVWRYEVKENDRHIIEGTTKGMVKLVTRSNGKILGCDILGANAGDLIHEYALAIKKGSSVGDISGLIHAYPTLIQANKRASDRYFSEKFFKGKIPKIVGWWLKRVRPRVV
jgi:pyruvate/2-oxoglutarate dehydrogenase complex dihydrolipoamide dehydrogenase (E3) component